MNFILNYDKTNVELIGSDLFYFKIINANVFIYDCGSAIKLKSKKCCLLSWLMEENRYEDLFCLLKL